MDAKKAGLSKTASQISSSLQGIALQTSTLATFTESLYREENKALARKNQSNYSLSANGVFYKPLDDGKSAVFVSGYVPVDQKIKDTVYFTEPLDSMLISIVKNNSDVTQVYYNDKNSYNRIYPFFDVMIQYQPKMNIPSFNFYYLADQQHNPAKNAVWVNEPYVDPAGRGWMISCIAPVYVNNSLEGVVGLDITLKGIMDKYINSSASNYLLVTDKGIIVSANDNLITLLSLLPLNDYKYMETIKSDQLLQDDFNMLKHRNLKTRQLGESILKQNKSNFVYEAADGKYTVNVTVIPELNWKLIQLIKL